MAERSTALPAAFKRKIEAEGCEVFVELSTGAADLNEERDARVG
jgi:hypothetical protein